MGSCRFANVKQLAFLAVINIQIYSYDFSFQGTSPPTKLRRWHLASKVEFIKFVVCNLKYICSNQFKCTVFLFTLLCLHRTHSVTGAPLTNARTISRQLIHDADRPHDKLNLLFMQFGQLLTHDVTQSASITTRMFALQITEHGWQTMLFNMCPLSYIRFF